MGGRINQLPQELIILIVSFLPFADAIRFTSLKRRWSNLWRYCKNIEFKERSFIDVCRRQRLLSRGHDSLDSDVRREGRRKFIEYANQTVASLMAPQFKKISICLHYEGGCGYNIDEWITLAISRGVEELNLYFSDEDLTEPSPNFFEPPSLPKFLYDFGRSLRVLCLVSCSLGSYSFKNLIVLSDVTLKLIEVSTQVINDLLRNCPLLDSLCLFSCGGLSKLEVSSTTLRLKTLVVRGCASLSMGIIKICAPRLDYFEYSGCVVNIELEGLEDLVSVDVQFDVGDYFHYHSEELLRLIRGLTQATNLTLCTTALTVLPSQYHLFCEPPFPLINLESFTLKAGMKVYELPVIMCLLACAPNLKTLKIETGFTRQIYDNLIDCHLNSMPENGWRPPRLPFARLKRIKVKGFEGSRNETFLLMFLIQNARVLETVYISCQGNLNDSHGQNFFPLGVIEELMNTQSASGKAEIIAYN